MRGVCAAMLTFEAIVLGLATPVMIMVEDVDRGLALALGLGLAGLALATAASLKYPAAYWVGHGIQVAAVALGFVVPVMFLLGAVFTALWIGAYVIGRKVDRDRASAA